MGEGGRGVVRRGEEGGGGEGGEESEYTYKPQLVSYSALSSHAPGESKVKSQ